MPIQTIDEARTEIINNGGIFSSARKLMPSLRRDRDAVRDEIGSELFDFIDASMHGGLRDIGFIRTQCGPFYNRLDYVEDSLAWNCPWSHTAILRRTPEPAVQAYFRAMRWEKGEVFEGDGINISTQRGWLQAASLIDVETFGRATYLPGESFAESAMARYAKAN